MRRFTKVQIAILLLFLEVACSTGTKLNRVDDTQIKALSSSAQLVLLNFWATWCEPCRTEIPELNRLHQKYPQVEFVGINVDDIENEGAIAPYLKKYPIEYTVLRRSGSDFKGMAQSIDTNWTGGVPATFLFQNGNRIFSKIGVIETKELDDFLQRAVAEM
jgi:thiol-disulfide isomerase/thioredoxin